MMFQASNCEFSMAICWAQSYIYPSTNKFESCSFCSHQHKYNASFSFQVSDFMHQIPLCPPCNTIKHQVPSYGKNFLPNCVVHLTILLNPNLQLNSYNHMVTYFFTCLHDSIPNDKFWCCWILYHNVKKPVALYMKQENLWSNWCTVVQLDVC